MTKRCTAWHIGGRKRFIECRVCGKFYYRATPHNSRLTAQAPLRQLRHGICVAKMLDNVGLRYPHRASGAKAPRTLRPLPLLRFAVFATGGAHLCSIQYYLRFWLGICRTSLAVSALRIMRYCHNHYTGPLPRLTMGSWGKMCRRAKFFGFVLLTGRTAAGCAIINHE